MPGRLGHQRPCTSPCQGARRYVADQYGAAAAAAACVPVRAGLPPGAAAALHRDHHDNTNVIRARAAPGAPRRAPAARRRPPGHRAGPLRPGGGPWGTAQGPCGPEAAPGAPRRAPAARRRPLGHRAGPLRPGGGPWGTAQGPCGPEAAPGAPARRGAPPAPRPCPAPTSNLPSLLFRSLAPRGPAPDNTTVIRADGTGAVLPCQPECGSRPPA